MKNSVFIGFLILILALGLGAFHSVEAKTVRVNGYYKPSTGTYVNSYYKTSPNSYKSDNYSSKGSYNPYTGKSGTKNYYRK
ncbi:MAG: hypothetical protein JWN89_444 [Parcubacteria group bacterium]|nr:hypothetical protein [Parcubacteria group bacterium]